MPKNSWKSRWEKVRSLSDEELISWLETARVSPRLARKLYEQTLKGPHNLHASHLEPPSALDLVWTLLRRLEPFYSGDTKCHPGWIKPFLWRELITHKADMLGEEILEMGYLFVKDDLVSASRLLDLYEDEQAHPCTRGNALFALLFAEIPDSQIDRLRRTVRHGLTNQENAFVRCTACMLADRDPTITLQDLEPLLKDEAGLKPGWGPLVKQYAREAVDRLTGPNPDREAALAEGKCTPALVG